MPILSILMMLAGNLWGHLRSVHLAGSEHSRQGKQMLIYPKT